MTADYKELLTYIVKNLVDEPEAIEVAQVDNEYGSVSLQLKVILADMGKVIGRQGRIAKEIRTILKAAGQRDSKRVDVTILD